MWGEDTKTTTAFDKLYTPKKGNNFMDDKSSAAVKLDLE